MAYEMFSGQNKYEKTEVTDIWFYGSYDFHNKRYYGKVSQVIIILLVYLLQLNQYTE